MRPGRWDRVAKSVAEPGLGVKSPASHWRALANTPKRPPFLRRLWHCPVSGTNCTKPANKGVAMFGKSCQAGISQTGIFFPRSFAIFWVTTCQKLLCTHQRQQWIVCPLASISPESEKEAYLSTTKKYVTYARCMAQGDVDGKNAWSAHRLCWVSLKDLRTEPSSRKKMSCPIATSGEKQ